MQPTEKELKDYAQAYCVFYKGRDLVKEGQFDEGQKLMRQSITMIGPAVINKVGAFYANTDLQFTMSDYHEYIGKAYLEKGNIEMALEHFYQWKTYIVSKYGYNDIKIVPCYVHIAKALQQTDPAIEELQTIDTTTLYGFCKYVKGITNVSMCYAKNMELPAKYYLKAYNIQKMHRGLDNSYTASLKDEILYFFWGNCLAMKTEQTLFMAEAFIPLLLLFLLLIHKPCWETIVVFIICVGVFVVWRILDIIIETWLTWRHYKTIL